MEFNPLKFPKIKIMSYSQLVLRIWLIISNVIFGLLAIGSIYPILLSPMMFDAPGSETNPGIALLLISLLSFPVVVILSIVMSWRFFMKKSFKKALNYSLIPFISLILMLLGGYLW